MTSPPPPGRRLHPTGRTIPSGLDEETITRVVGRFYGRARRDEVIGPVFNRVIAEADWPHHLDLIADFWSSMLLGSGRYGGRPMPKHLAIGELNDAHFARWLMLFRQTTEELCTPEVAALFVDRAERVAHSFRLGLQQVRGTDAREALDVLRAQPAPWRPDEDAED